MRQCEGVLLPDVVLPFDDPELAGCTVADVLADPDKFEGATLADPLEGVDYGTGKAQIMRRADGSIWIHSFAHGRTVYDLKLDAAAVRAILERADKEAVAKLFIELAMTADLDEGELEHSAHFHGRKIRARPPRHQCPAQGGAGEEGHPARPGAARPPIGRTADPRPRIAVPDTDQDWLPQMVINNDVLGVSPASKPPTRNIDGTMTRARKLSLPNLHAFAHSEADGNDLPAPEQWTLRQMNEMEVAELIEQHIDYVDENGRSVHLPMPFVRHYVNRDDGALPTVVAIATLPIVLGDGSLLAPDGLDRDRGIIFEIQKELRAVLPRRQDCTAAAIREAMEFLCRRMALRRRHRLYRQVHPDCRRAHPDRALAAAGPAGLLRHRRPARRRQDHDAQMLIKAVTGDWPAAAAWSSNEEERRKALLSYFLSGVSYILWDNIPRGAQISCPHIEKVLHRRPIIPTASSASPRWSRPRHRPSISSPATISDRAAISPPAASISASPSIARTPKIAISSIPIRSAGPNPIAPTSCARSTPSCSAIRCSQSAAPKAKTRFKTWWRLVGSAVEHGAKLIGQQLDFQELFTSQEEDDEEAASLADALAVMRRRWPTFKANDVADLINRKDADAGLDLTPCTK